MSKRKIKTAEAAVGYIRMSSDKQEESPEQQRDEILKLAEKHGYQIVRWYEDYAISGVKTLKRKQFLQMIDDVKRLGDFRAILCWDQDRFGRFDSIEAGEWISPLRRAGVELICVVQGRINWDDFAGRMVYQITQEGKNQFLVSLSNNVMRGMLKQARDGYGKRRSPFGYDRVYFDEAGNEMHRVVGSARFAKPKGWKAKLAPSEAEHEVETVKWMFDAYANTDANSRSIASDLNRRGIKTRSGIDWQCQSVRVVLRNPVYIGTMIYGANPQGRFNRVGDGHLCGNEPVVIKNAHPAIIDKKTFDRVQRKLDARRRPNGRTRASDYLLSGLVICGNSGDRMCGRRASVGTNVQYYGARASNGAGQNEHCYSIRKDQLEPLVIGKIVGLLDTPNIKGQIESVIARRLKTSATKTHDTRSLRQRIAELEKNIAKGVERLLLLDGADLDDASRMLADWRAQRRSLEEQLQTSARNPSASPDREAARVAAELADLRRTFALADPRALRAALASVIEEITLYWTDGGPRKWRFQRGTIRLGGSLRLLASSTNLFLPLFVVIAAWRVAFHSPSPLVSAQDTGGTEAVEMRPAASDDPLGDPVTGEDPFGGGAADAKIVAWQLRPYSKEFRVELIDVADDGQSLRKGEVRGVAQVKPVSRNELPEVRVDRVFEVKGLGLQGVQPDDMYGEMYSAHGDMGEMYGGGMGDGRSSQLWQALDERHREDVLQRVTWQAQADWVRRLLGSRVAPDEAEKESLKDAIREVLKKQYTNQLRRQAVAVDVIEQRVKALRESLAQRADASDRVVEFELQRMELEAAGMGLGPDVGFGSTESQRSGSGKLDMGGGTF